MYGVSHTTLSRYFARPDVARQLRHRPDSCCGPNGELPGRRCWLGRRSSGKLALVRRQLARERAAGRVQSDQASQLAEAPAHPDVDRHAAAVTALCYVEQLEAAHQHAFAAIETLASAIERIQQLRDQQHVWDPDRPLAGYWVSGCISGLGAVCMGCD